MSVRHRITEAVAWLALGVCVAGVLFFFRGKITYGARCGWTACGLIILALLLDIKRHNRNL